LSSPTFIAYIDESGDEGFVLGSGASEWFVLGAIVLRRASELAEVKLIDEVRQGINLHRQPQHRIPDKKPLHFRDLRHEQRKFYASRISQADLHTVSVLINKGAIAAPENFIEQSRLYFYAVRLLIERISWYCRDHKRRDEPGDGSVKLVFSNKSNMDYDALRAYLRHLEANRVALGYRAAQGIILPDQVLAYTPGKRMGLQIVDAVASSHFFAVETNHYGFTEDTYVKLLLPRAYRHQGQLWGYGIKIMPRETEERRRAGDILAGW